jgi:hypothetical protein
MAACYMAQSKENLNFAHYQFMVTQSHTHQHVMAELFSSHSVELGTPDGFSISRLERTLLSTSQTAFVMFALVKWFKRK